MEAKIISLLRSGETGTATAADAPLIAVKSQPRDHAP
jgi:hypothetical protein